LINLLIVDDEAIILDGLTELFHTVGIADLEVHRANSGVQALRIMERNRIDIVLTDIRMPEMTGLELFDRVRERRKRCKFVFLTGYSDFGYVQEVLRKGGADYVLKMEGDDDIVSAVRKAIADLHEELDVERFVSEAKSKMKRLQPLAQREYIGHLLLGEPFAPAGLKSRFEELDIPFSEAAPVYLLLGKADSWEAIDRPSDRTLLLYALQNIAGELLPPSCATLSLALDGAALLWLIQPRDAEETAELQLSLDRIQQAAVRFLSLRFSFACSGLFEWTDIGRVYDRLRDLLHQGAGIGEEISYLGSEGGAGMDDRRADELRTELKRFVFLEAHLENGKADEFDRDLVRLLNAADRNRVPLALSLEAFNRMSSLLLSHLNRNGLQEIAEDPDRLHRLTRYDAFASWEDTIAFFRETSAALFAHRKKMQADRGAEIVGKVEDFVARHLGEDLSLNRLGQAVYLNPAYLSRLYKQLTGVGLSDYVTDRRIRKAKELLRSTDRKIQEITVAVGLESPSYFARLFKRLTGKSPQEYRES